jgi:hypothetical protein
MPNRKHKEEKGYAFFGCQQIDERIGNVDVHLF